MTFKSHRGRQRYKQELNASVADSNQTNFRRHVTCFLCSIYYLEGSFRMFSPRARSNHSSFQSPVHLINTNTTIPCLGTFQKPPRARLKRWYGSEEQRHAEPQWKQKNSTKWFLLLCVCLLNNWVLNLNWNCIRAQKSVGIERHHKCEGCTVLRRKTAECGI